MTFFVIILALVSLGLWCYVRTMNRQIRRMRQILVKRVEENTCEMVSCNLMNKELELLAKSMNICLKEDEKRRLKAVRDEKQFKEMIANVSHDLRTPLTAVKGYQQLLAKSSLDEKQEYALAFALKHTDELGTLIEHFFEYSALMNREIPVNFERINLVNLIAECLSGIVSMFEERGMQVRFEQKRPIYVQADQEMLTRIIQNLLRNCALHADGDVTIRIEDSVKTAENTKNMQKSQEIVKVAEHVAEDITEDVTEHGRNGRIIVYFENPVQDIESIDPERMFERFYTGNQSGNYSNGLGLTIVKMLTEKMGGQTGAFIKNKKIVIWVSLEVD